MHQPLGVDVIQRRSDLRQEGDGPLRFHLPCLVQYRSQGAARQVGHSDVEIALALASVIDGDNVRVVQPCRCQRFAAETRSELGVVGPVGMQHLESYGAFQHRVPRPVDDGKAAPAQLGDEFISLQTTRLGHLS